jgi:hypothetical protein
MWVYFQLQVYKTYSTWSLNRVIIKQPTNNGCACQVYELATFEISWVRQHEVIPFQEIKKASVGVKIFALHWKM